MVNVTIAPCYCSVLRLPLYISDHNTYTEKDSLLLHYYSIIDVTFWEIKKSPPTDYRTDKIETAGAPEALKRFHAEVKELNCLLAYAYGQLYH